MYDQEKHENTTLAHQYKMHFYENEFPAEGELVMGQSEKSEENGCYVALLEYNNKVGMMPINQYTTSMRRAIHRAMKVGKREILRVIRVDRDKGYIDLSKKQVNVEDENEGQQKYANSTQLHSILIHVAQHCNVPIQDLYQKYIWPLYKQETEHPLVFFKHALINEEKMKFVNTMEEAVRNTLIDELRRRFKRPIIKTMANFSTSCRSFEGIHAIKKVIQAGIDEAKEKGYDVKIFIIGAPKYTCEVSSVTIEAGRQALNIVLKTIQAKTKDIKGDFVVDRHPYIVGDTNQHIKQMIKEEEVVMVAEGDDSDMGEAD